MILRLSAPTVVMPCMTYGGRMKLHVQLYRVHCSLLVQYRLILHMHESLFCHCEATTHPILVYITITMENKLKLNSLEYFRDYPTLRSLHMLIYYSSMQYKNTF